MSDFPPLVPPGPQPCKICGTDAPEFGRVDFSQSANEMNIGKLPPTGIDVSYNQCPACQFLFTCAFDKWTHDDFRHQVYNDDYLAVDPDYVANRPMNNAGLITRLFGHEKNNFSVLDYGGGNGKLVELLRQQGFTAETYDPFDPAHDQRPDEKFNLITCFETLEHVPDPLQTIQTIADLTAEPGLVLFSTLLQPADFARQKLTWWYAGPRNGHISLFSRKSLALAWDKAGFKVGGFNENIHIAFREIPAFANALLKK